MRRVGGRIGLVKTVLVHTGIFALVLKRCSRFQANRHGSFGVMSVPGVDQVGERALEDLVRHASQ